MQLSSISNIEQISIEIQQIIKVAIFHSKRTNIFLRIRYSYLMSHFVTFYGPLYCKSQFETMNKKENFTMRRMVDSIWKYNLHIPNIDYLISDILTLRIQYKFTQKQCVGVAIEGMDIWYMGITFF